MPGFDGTGPLGQGRLGRGFGPCGRGFGFRRGFGRGFGWGQQRFHAFNTAALTRDDEKKALEAELAQIIAEKEALEKELKEMQ